MKLEKVIDMGDTVLCDLCNEDWTTRTESGGILVGSHAWCPTCEPAALRNMQEHNEMHLLKGKCPEGVSFADWVRQLRGGDNKIKYFSMDSPSELLDVMSGNIKPGPGTSPLPTPYAVRCPRHGLVHLTKKEYEQQMMAANSLWKCPTCGMAAQWDDDTLEKAMKEEEASNGD